MTLRNVANERHHLIGIPIKLNGKIKMPIQQIVSPGGCEIEVIRKPSCAVLQKPHRVLYSFDISETPIFKY